MQNGWPVYPTSCLCLFTASMDWLTDWIIDWLLDSWIAMVTTQLAQRWVRLPDWDNCWWSQNQVHVTTIIPLLQSRLPSAAQVYSLTRTHARTHTHTRTHVLFNRMMFLFNRMMFLFNRMMFLFIRMMFCLVRWCILFNLIMFLFIWMMCLWCNSEHRLWWRHCRCSSITTCRHQLATSPATHQPHGNDLVYICFLSQSEFHLFLTSVGFSLSAALFSFGYSNGLSLRAIHLVSVAVTHSVISRTS